MVDENMGGNGNPEYEIPENERVEEATEDIVAEFAALGRNFAEAIKTAWNSEERYRLQSELKDGLNKFAEEVNEAMSSLRKTEASQKVGEGVQQAASEVKSGRVADEVRKGTVTVLREISSALDNMANSFTPREGTVEGMADDVADAAGDMADDVADAANDVFDA